VVVKCIGINRVACFASAPGTTSTLYTGDQIEKTFTEAKILALEPYECLTLTNVSIGQHRIKFICDKMYLEKLVKKKIIFI
jgi:hypothetical protein